MTSGKLAPARLSRLRSRRLRERFCAPELERYLARGSIDPAMTDQPEAVKVRVLRGVEVFRDRVRVALVSGGRRQSWLLVAGGIGAGALLAAAVSGAASLPVLGTLAVALLAALGWLFVRLRRDVILLKRLVGRYQKPVAECSDTEELLALSQKIFEEACLVGGISEENPKSREGNPKSQIPKGMSP